MKNQSTSETQSETRTYIVKMDDGKEYTVEAKKNSYAHNIAKKVARKNFSSRIVISCKWINRNKKTRKITISDQSILNRLEKFSNGEIVELLDGVVSKLCF